METTNKQVVISALKTIIGGALCSPFVFANRPSHKFYHYLSRDSNLRHVVIKN